MWNLTEQGCPTGRLFLFYAIYGSGDGNDRNKRKRDENTGLAYRKLPGKVGKRFFSDGKAKPRGVSEKIILAGGCGIFPESLALPEAFAVGPL
ncbi:hypothetical protein [Phocaeicola dorei]|uniref:hypothetical protein n=1 Tax=Phocaeicola dorei TaxID=357276 RepID=UPI002166B401|nr:hypothetical protein [Phocaeicola dorei]MCS2239606.1 hypothetical protein [Phocaeicola dorei]